MAKTFSGRQVIKVLVKFFGFTETGIKGSHVKLKKIGPSGEICTIVPLHKELARGTLSGILDLAKVEYRDFIEVVQKEL